MNDNKYSVDDDIAVAEDGRKYWNSFEEKHDLDNSVVILLAGEDKKIDRLTMTFAGELKNKKKYEYIYFLNATSDLKELFKEYSNYIFIDIDEKDIIALKKLYMLYKFSDRFIVNTFKDTSDADAFDLVDRNITVEDIVRISVLGL